MLTTIEGVYRDGRVELSETPESAEERPVSVTFLKGDGANGSTKAQAGQMIRFGMFLELNALTDEELTSMLGSSSTLLTGPSSSGARAWIWPSSTRRTTGRSWRPRLC